MAETKTYTALAIERLAAAAILWVWINVGADVVNMLAAATDIVLLTRLPNGTPLGPYGEIPDAGFLGLFTGLIRLVLIVSAVVSAFVVLKWVYRASRNAQSFARGLKNSPRWAVGWFFVPVAFLWKPFEAMSETWRATHDPNGWKSASAPDVMRVWWGFWLASTLLGNLSFRLGVKAQATTMLTFATALELVSAGCSIVAGVALTRIIGRISQRQTKFIAVGAASGPPVPAPTDPTQPWGSADGSSVS